MDNAFDYQKKMWGHCEVDLLPKHLGATRLKYLFNTLENELPKTDIKILDIGCGGGAFCRAVKKYYPKYSVYGLDINAQAIKVAQKMSRNIDYIQGDIYKLPFKNETFDAVLSFDVWEHLSDPVKALEQVYQVLKPGGILHLFIPVEGNPFTLYQLLPKSFYKYKQKFTGHIQSYSNKSIKILLHESGFQVVRSHNSSYYLYQLVDLMYFTYLNLKGGDATQSIEGYLATSEGNLIDKILYLAKNIFGWLTYFEDMCLKYFPGGGLHITARKLAI